MNDDVEKPKKSPVAWLKDVNVLIGIAGVVATIIVGVVTYWLTADSATREYQERIRVARNDVLIAVARSIGEGVVPRRNMVQSVLNSVRRQHNVKEADFETPDSVVDDILTRVLANEFLDAKRREELSEKLMAVKETQAGTSDGKKIGEGKPERLKHDSFSALAFALSASMLAAVTMLFISERFKRAFREERSRPDPALLFLRQALVMLVALIAIVITTWALFTAAGKEPDVLRLLFQRSELSK